MSRICPTFVRPESNWNYRAVQVSWCGEICKCSWELLGASVLLGGRSCAKYLRCSQVIMTRWIWLYYPHWLGKRNPPACADTPVSSHILAAFHFWKWFNTKLAQPDSPIVSFCPCSSNESPRIFRPASAVASESATVVSAAGSAWQVWKPNIFEAGSAHRNNLLFQFSLQMQKMPNYLHSKKKYWLQKKQHQKPGNQRFQGHCASKAELVMHIFDWHGLAIFIDMYSLYRW